MADEKKEQQSTDGVGLPEAEEVLTDLEKKIKVYRERAEISYHKKEEKIRQRNSHDQEGLQKKLERLSEREAKKLEKIEEKLKKKDPKWQKQQKLEKKKEKRAKKIADKKKKQKKKQLKKKKKQIKKQQAKVNKLKKIEEKKRKTDYQYQYSQESARVEQYIADMEKKINQRINEISVKEVDQLEKLKTRYEKMLDRATANIRKKDPEWAAAEKERVAAEKEEAKKKKEADKQKKKDKKTAAAEERAAQKSKKKDSDEKQPAKKVKAKDLKAIRLFKRERKNGTSKEKRKPFKEWFPEFLEKFNYVLLYNGKTVNLLAVGSVLFFSLFAVIATGILLWSNYGPVPAHKVVDRYLQAFCQQDDAMLQQYGSGEYAFIAEKIMNQENFAPVREIMEDKIYDIDYKILDNGTWVGEQMRVDVEITNYDLGAALTSALEEYREENYLAYFSGKYTDADLEDSLVAILQETMSQTEKNYTETIPVYLAKNDEDKWRIVALGNSNPYLTKMLTGCVYQPALDEHGEVLHIPYNSSKVWTEDTPAYQDLMEAMDNVLNPENAIFVNAG